jgi:hypothetical protein
MQTIEREMRRKTEKVTIENKWGEGKQEGKKAVAYFCSHER